MDLRAALIEAGRMRLILMTTFALIAGMIPVALGLGERADSRAPLERGDRRCDHTAVVDAARPTVYEILDEILDDWREWLIEPIFRRFVRGRANARRLNRRIGVRSRYA